MPKLIFALFFCLFVTVRIIFHQGDRQNSTSIHNRREVLLATQFSIVLSILHLGWIFGDFLHFAELQLPIFLQVSGALTMGGSIIYLYTIHRALGSNFSATLEIQSDHHLVQDGPYSHTRHPMYGCGLLFLIGAGFLSANAAVLLMPSLSFLLLIAMRIGDEEKMLEQHFPAEWPAYKANTGLFFPKLY